jgi:hypothetical protein
MDLLTCCLMLRKKRIELLEDLSKPVIVNSVVDTLEEINAPFVRINAWPGFLKATAR